MTDIQPHMMTDAFGFFGGWWRLLVLSLFERKPEPGVLLIDTISVAPAMRGHGVGTKLLDVAFALAREHGYTQVSLEVVDTNPRARQLYERKGFVAVKTQHTPYLRRIFGFSASTLMMKSVE